MKSKPILIILLCICLSGFSHGGIYNNKPNIMEQKKTETEIPEFAKNIHWLGQAAVKITYNGKVIYIDPYQLKISDKADLILITHDHQDHLSLKDIEKIAGKNTRFVVAEVCKEKLEKAGFGNIQTMKPGSEYEVAGLHITAVPAYNVTRPMHQKSMNYVGYVIDFDGIRVYHTGDTERIPEMKEIRCDIIMLPLGQTYTMTSVEEAVNVVLDTKASVAIPIHWGLYEGSAADARNFSEILRKRNIRVSDGDEHGR